MRYKFYTTDNKVICVSHYAGKPVRGIAKCDPKDTFNYEDGKKLALARCDEKIAKKREARAAARLNEAKLILAEAQAYMERMENYHREAVDEMINAHATLTAIEASL